VTTVEVDTVAPILDWLRHHGFRTTGYAREHLACPEDSTEWRTEMQFPIEAIPGP